MNRDTLSVFAAGMVLLASVLLSGCRAFAFGDPPVTAPRQTQGANPLAPTAISAVDLPTAVAPAAPAATPTLAPQPTPTIHFAPVARRAADCSYGGAIEAIEAVDVTTVRFALCQPDVAFLSKIAFPAFAIYPQEWIDGLGSPGASPDQPVGSGPYQFAEWTRDERLVFHPNPAYWRPQKPAVSELIFRWEIDASLRLVELQSGTADGIDAVNVADFEAIKSDPLQKLVLRPPLNVAYLGMNNRIPPFDDVRVRRAISLAIDRRQLIAAAFPDGYEAADYFTPCTLPFGCSGAAFEANDPAEAQALLAEAGFGSGFEVELFYRDVVRGYLPWPELAAKNIQTQLKGTLKINTRLRVMEEEQFYAELDRGALPGLYLLGWGADYADIDNFLSPHFGAQAGPQFGDPFPDLVETLAAAAGTVDPNRREELYAAANTFLSRQVPMAPLAHGGWISHNSRAMAFSTSLANPPINPFGIEDFSGLVLPNAASFVWIQAAEPLTLMCGLANETESLRACAQIAETLYRFIPGTAVVEPGLAERCTPDESLKTWTCTLQPGIRFHDGSLLDAGDVMASYVAQWDADSVLHKLNPDGFVYFRQFWPGFLNAAPR